MDASCTLCYISLVIQTDKLTPFIIIVIVTTEYLCEGLARAMYIHRIFGDFPAKIAVHTPHIYRVGQNRIYTLYMTMY